MDASHGRLVASKGPRSSRAKRLLAAPTPLSRVGRRCTDKRVVRLWAKTIVNASRKSCSERQQTMWNVALLEVEASAEHP